MCMTDREGTLFMPQTLPAQISRHKETDNQHYVTVCDRLKIKEELSQWAFPIAAQSFHKVSFLFSSDKREIRRHVHAL